MCRGSRSRGGGHDSIPSRGGDSGEEEEKVELRSAPKRHAHSYGEGVESHVSRGSPATSADDGSDSDPFSEPDPDSSDEWLPSGSSRDSSPDAAERFDEGKNMLSVYKLRR